MSKQRLEGKVAIVTGGASGIGEASVRVFVENGALVVIADVQDELGHQVVASIGEGKVSYHHCDVRDEKQVEQAVNFTLEKHGRLDVLFSNAGITGIAGSSRIGNSGILELDFNDFDNVMATNVRGVAATIKYAARAMVDKQIRGSIVCTASVAASLGVGAPHGYTASKHAVVGLVRSACDELGAYGIRVNCISPFGVATPLARAFLNMEANEVEESTCALASLKGVVLKTTDIAEAALFLASDESGFITGHNLVVDGGFTVTFPFPAKLKP